jgi:hypothetical protein
MNYAKSDKSEITLLPKKERIRTHNLTYLAYLPTYLCYCAYCAKPLFYEGLTPT